MICSTENRFFFMANSPFLLQEIRHATGDRVAQLFNTGKEDLIGSWRWRVWLDHKMQEGSTRSGAEARKTYERLMAEYLQAQIAQQ